MRIMIILFSILGTVGACKGKTPEGKPPPKIDLSTPADTGRTLCAILASEDVDLIGQLAPWDKQAADCNSLTTFAMKRQGKAVQETYPECAEQAIKDSWKQLAVALAKTKSPCTVERPNSGRLEEVEIVSLNGTREKLKLSKGADGRWHISDELPLSDARRAVLELKFKEAADAESGFGKK